MFCVSNVDSIPLNRVSPIVLAAHIPARPSSRLPRLVSSLKRSASGISMRTLMRGGPLRQKRPPAQPSNPPLVRRREILQARIFALAPFVPRRRHSGESLLPRANAVPTARDVTSTLGSCLRRIPTTASRDSDRSIQRFRRKASTHRNAQRRPDVYTFRLPDARTSDIIPA